MDKRVLLASVVSMGVVLVWIAFFGKKPTTRSRAAAGDSGRSAPAGDRPTSGERASRGARRPTAQAEAARRQAGRQAEGPPAPPATKADAGRDDARGAEALQGDLHVGGRGAVAAGCCSIRSTRKTIRRDEQQAGGADRPGRARARRTCRSTITFPSVGVQRCRPTRSGRSSRAASDGELVYVWEDDDVARREALHAACPAPTRSSSSSPSRTRRDKPIAARTCRCRCTASRIPNVKPGGMFSQARDARRGRLLRQRQGQARQRSTSLLKKGTIERRGDVRWVGVGEQYFVDGGRRCRRRPRQQRCCNVFAARRRQHQRGHDAAGAQRSRRTARPSTSGRLHGAEDPVAARRREGRRRSRRTSAT